MGRVPSEETTIREQIFAPILLHSHPIGHPKRSLILVCDRTREKAYQMNGRRVHWIERGELLFNCVKRDTSKHDANYFHQFRIVFTLVHCSRIRHLWVHNYDNKEAHCVCVSVCMCVCVCVCEKGSEKEIDSGKTICCSSLALP